MDKEKSQDAPVGNSFNNSGNFNIKGNLNQGNHNEHHHYGNAREQALPGQEAAKPNPGARAQNNQRDYIPPVNPVQPPLGLFYCYALEDQALRNELDAHLITLKESQLITSWYDGLIFPGASWQEEVKKHLEQADVILLLISSDFLNSERGYRQEMKRALERHEHKEACVIPIILRPVDWSYAPFSHLQVLPSNREPILSSAWRHRDEAFRDVAIGIRRTVAHLIGA